MNRTWSIILGVAMLAMALVGCGGGSDGGAVSKSAPGLPAAGGGDEELTKQWGPEEMPEQEAQPLEFLYWRVDRLFVAEDLDADGRLTPDEYSGASVNFERIDANTDGFLTKKEVIDDNIVRLREDGKIP